jgi:NADPH-dependent glutamate synthase beta subunit-like oxidoreductase
MQDNPFPAVMGRVCYRPCETACNWAQPDSAVGINSVERFLGNEALRQGWQVPVDAAPTGKRVLVVGAGAVRPVRRLAPRPYGLLSHHQGGPQHRRLAP